MNYNEVKELISIVDKSTLTNFELDIDNVSVKMSKGANAAETVAQAKPTIREALEQAAPVIEEKITAMEPVKEAPAVEETPSGNAVKSPIVGTFYASPGPDRPPFVSKGDKVKKGDVVCIVEAMKIMNEITSDFDGEVKETLVENGQLVEYGQPLIIVG